MGTLKFTVLFFNLDTSPEKGKFLFSHVPCYFQAFPQLAGRILLTINNNHQEEIFRILRQWTFRKWYKGVKFKQSRKFLNKFPRNRSKCTFRTSVRWIFIDYHKATSLPYFPVSPPPGHVHFHEYKGAFGAKNSILIGFTKNQHRID